MTFLTKGLEQINFFKIILKINFKNFCTFLNSGRRFMQGGHQGAKKSMNTGSPLVMTSGKSPVARVRNVRACTERRANAATS